MTPHDRVRSRCRIYWINRRGERKNTIPLRNYEVPAMLEYIRLQKGTPLYAVRFVPHGIVPKEISP